MLEILDRAGPVLQLEERRHLGPRQGVDLGLIRRKDLSVSLRSEAKSYLERPLRVLVEDPLCRGKDQVEMGWAKLLEVSYRRRISVQRVVLSLSLPEGSVDAWKWTTHS